MANTKTSGPSTTKRRNTPSRKHEVHAQQTCFKCKQEGHYTRNCPHVINQKPTETKMEKMQALIRSMTATERAEFKRHILNDKDKPRTKTMTNPPNRETTPHADQTFLAVPPSRETGPHTNQSIKRLVEALRRSTKTSDRCKRGDGIHPTHIRTRQFPKSQKSELTPCLTLDDDSMESDTPCNSEKSEDDEIKPMIDPPIPPVKTVTFDLSAEESKKNSILHHADKPESDNKSDNDNTDIQQFTSQDDETDA